MNIRCSALPRIMSCHASIEKPTVEIDAESSPAKMGTAAHRFYEQMVKNDLTYPLNIDSIAEKHTLTLTN